MAFVCGSCKAVCGEADWICKTCGCDLWEVSKKAAKRLRQRERRQEANKQVAEAGIYNSLHQANTWETRGGKG